MKQIKFIVFGLLFGMAGFLVGVGFSNYYNFDKNLSIQDNSGASFIEEVENKQNSVSIMIDTGDDLIGFSSVLLQQNDTVYSVLKRLTESNDEFTIDVTDYGDLGIFVNSINGTQGDNNKYWQYWVNNEYGQISSDKYILEQDDVVMWKFTSSKFENY